MSAKAVRERSASISSRFHAQRDEIADGSELVVSTEQIDRFETLASGAIYLLRDNKATCIRVEQLQQRDGHQVIDVDLLAAKAEIDTMIEALIEWKFALRQARKKWASGGEQVPEASEEQLQLASMYRSGVLSSSEYAQLQERLQAAQGAGH